MVTDSPPCARAMIWSAFSLSFSFKQRAHQDHGEELLLSPCKAVPPSLPLPPGQRSALDEILDGLHVRLGKTERACHAGELRAKGNRPSANRERAISFQSAFMGRRVAGHLEGIPRRERRHAVFGGAGRTGKARRPLRRGQRICHRRPIPVSPGKWEAADAL